MVGSQLAYLREEHNDSWTTVNQVLIKIVF